MRRKRTIVCNALLLTAVNLLLRFTSTSFQVYLSGRIGAAGIGLLQLVLSVGGLAITFGMGGIRTATMYLCAEAVGQKRSENMGWVLSGCIRYSLLLSLPAGMCLYYFAPQIAARWIGDITTVNAVRLLACLIPINCLCGVMVGHYTGMNRIGTLAAVEVGEQIFTMAATILLLNSWADNDPSKACQAVILSGGFGACFTLTLLLLLKQKEYSKIGKRVSVRKKLCETAIPLAIADDLKVGINTAENLMVPKRLALYVGETAPLAAFGTVCGMVFPVLMFPAAILFALAELLIPELARCNAAGSTQRIKHLTERSFLLSLLYGCLCGAILFLCAENLCERLYQTTEAGRYLRMFALLAPMLYCDAIVDAMTKGLGQQKICVRYNIITAAMDVALLFILLPKYGMSGYFFSFFITHLVNFILSIRLLQKMAGKIMSVRAGILCIAATGFSVTASHLVNSTWGSCVTLIMLYASLLVLFGVIHKKDIQWFKSLLFPTAVD